MMTGKPITKSDIEIWLRDRLRQLPLYARLRTLTLQTTNRTDSGWTADVAGDFTTTEQVQVKDLLAEFQRRFRLEESRSPRTTGARL